MAKQQLVELLSALARVTGKEYPIGVWTTDIIIDLTFIVEKYEELTRGRQ